MCPPNQLPRPTQIPLGTPPVHALSLNFSLALLQHQRPARHALIDIADIVDDRLEMRRGVVRLGDEDVVGVAGRGGRVELRDGGESVGGASAFFEAFSLRSLPVYSNLGIWEDAALMSLDPAITVVGPLLISPHS